MAQHAESGIPVQMFNRMFNRIDPSPDAEFYTMPRFVQHIDDEAIAAFSAAILRHVHPGSDVLDLMSSWVSRLPPRDLLPLGRVVGLGLNDPELAANPRLDAWVVRDLNGSPEMEPPLPFPDASFDAALISVSIQYLTDPVRVLRDVARVLRPGGVLIVAISDRMFATKATQIWRETPAERRPSLVARYVAQAGGFGPPRVEVAIPARRRPGDGDPLWLVVTEANSPDGSDRPDVRR